jgi:hypothetical protein
MARVNIEDSLFKDGPFLDLCIALGDKDKALGLLCRLFLQAQRFYLSHGEIPQDTWETQKFPECLLNVGFVVQTKTGVRVRGQDEQFGWLKESQKAGQKSAKLRSSKKKSKKQGTLAKVEGTYQVAQPPSPSPSPSLTHTHSLAPIVGENSFAPENPVGFFIWKYSKAWQERYNTKSKPHVGGPEIGKIKNFLKYVPVQKAVELIQIYCQMDGPNSKFKLRNHDMDAFFWNQNQIIVALERGDDSQINWKNVFGADYVEPSSLKVLEGGK